MLQALAVNTNKLILEAFRKSVSYACKALVEYFELMKGLIQVHPTSAMRYILENPNIYARAEMGIIEIFGCTQLAPDSCRITNE